ncbi:MAG: cellulase family glycosylhydrolase [Spirochaetaceae bacterium]|jgi:aryl-phospho-beta-D-glucosidase BglC (GH1 family)|nr:cellulase family glycosylhydrolase [Spirochaetaceae bacterium]
MKHPRAIIEAIDSCIEQGIYVIMDWHGYTSAMDYCEEEVSLMKGIATTYGDCPNILYEIGNEPKNDVTWTGTVTEWATSNASGAYSGLWTSANSDARVDWMNNNNISWAN